MAVEAELLTWSEINGVNPTPALLRERLAPFALDTVLILLAQVAAVRQTWRNDPAWKNDEELTDELLPSYRTRIKAIRRPHHIAFSRIGILYVAKQACTACQCATVVSEPTPADIEQILTCCLIAHDVFIGRRALVTDRTIEKAATLLPLANYVPHDTFPRDLARNLLLVDKISPALKDRKDYIDVSAAFIKAAGIPPGVFIELSWIASIPHITAKRQPNEPFILRPDYLAHETITQAHIDAFFQRSSITVQDLHEQSQQRDPLDVDFLALQRTPLVKVGPNAYIAPDPGFLIDKAGTSFYWTLHEATSPAERHTLLTFWAVLFEHYLHWLCTASYRGKGTIHATPCFANNDEACDLIITEGSCLIMIEAKASILTTKAKYGFDPSALGRELFLKAITGDEGERKGVAQLHYNIDRWLKGDDIVGIDRTKIKMIYPVLLFLDHAFTGPYVHDLYNEHFDRRALQRRPRRTMTPLIALNINDLENCLPYTHHHGLAAMLDSYYRYARQQGPVNRQFRVPLLDGKQAGCDLVRDELNRFGNEIVQRRQQYPPPSQEDEALTEGK